MKKAHHFIAPRRHWAAMFALATLLIIVMGLVYYRYEENHIRQEKYHELAAIAELKAGQILRWRQEQLADARRLANSPLTRKAVADWLRDPSASGL
jgi:peptidoglycan/LPS O-acetylase OafA/YrhL